MSAPFIPEIADEGTEAVFYDNGIVAGAWADAMRFAHFDVSDFQPVDDAGAQNTDALSFAQPPFFHEGDNSRV